MHHKDLSKWYWKTLFFESQKLDIYIAGSASDCLTSTAFTAQAGRQEAQPQRRESTSLKPQITARSRRLYCFLEVQQTATASGAGDLNIRSLTLIPRADCSCHLPLNPSREPEWERAALTCHYLICRVRLSKLVEGQGYRLAV